MREFYFPYYSEYQQAYQIPLSRFLTPLPIGMVRKWIKETIPKGSWILDPFGMNPMLAIEAANEGYQVLVVSNNPIVSFELEVLATKPTEQDFAMALANFALIKRGNERISTQLERVYQTKCSACNQIIPAQAFLWRKGESYPYGKIYHCTFCGDSGERASVAFDVEQYKNFSSDLHRYRAIERAMLGIETSRTTVEEVLDYILPRQLYFLFALLNRIESSPELGKTDKVLLTSLFLNVCDHANVLWVYPTGRSYPKQLYIPPQFREENLWRVFENSTQQWVQQLPAVKVSYFPEMPSGEGGICLYRGSIRTLPPLMNQIPIKSVVALLPRPNQAFWSFSALWSSWLWGKEAALPLQRVFERKRFDWFWHSYALGTVLLSLKRHIGKTTPIFGIAPNIERGLLTAIVASVIVAGLEWEGVAIQENENLMQFHFNFADQDHPQFEMLEPFSVIGQYLLNRNMPFDFLKIYAICLKCLSTHKIDADIDKSDPRSIYQWLSDKANKIITDKDKWLIFQKGRGGIENDFWWIRNEQKVENDTISDSIERDVINLFTEYETISFNQVMDFLSGKYRGVDTPSYDFIRLILESYGDIVPSKFNQWRLDLRETVEVRNHDLETVKESIRIIGNKLGYEVTGDDDVSWTTKDANNYDYLFIAQTTCSLGHLLNNGKRRVSTKKSLKILVLPGSRAKLFLYKLEHDPRLSMLFAADWKVMKFRHIRQISERQDLTRDLWETLLEGDPLRWEESTQLSMFDMGSSG